MSERPAAWQFSSSIVTPTGVHVDVHVNVPANMAGPRINETAEIAQMAAVQALAAAEKAGIEVPF